MQVIYNVFLASLAVLFLGQEGQPREGGNFFLVNNMRTFAKENPNMQRVKNRYVIYTLGQRERGDSTSESIGKVEGRANENQAAEFVKVTYVEVKYEGNGFNQVYVVDGGIGQRNITLALAEKKLIYAKIYGTNTLSSQVPLYCKLP